MSRTNKTRYIECHETFEWKSRLNAIVCNNKQRWNKGKCRCECKELIDKWTCDKKFILNFSHCECECDKSRDDGEYLDYENCKCRKKLMFKLVEEHNENIDGNEMIYNGNLNDYEKECDSCTIYVVLFVTAFFISISFNSAFFSFSLYLRKVTLKQQFVGHANGKY